MTEREASFSSYLKPEQPIVVHNDPSLYTHNQHRPISRCQTVVDDSTEISIFDAKKYFNEVSNTNMNRISPVLNMVNISDTLEQIPEQLCNPRFSSASASSSVVDGGPGYNIITSRNVYRARSFHASTPTASSEASWNSRTGLLTNPAGPAAVSISLFRDRRDQKIKAGGKGSSLSSSAGRIWLFRRSSRCPCSGKKSVQVLEESKISSEPKTPPNSKLPPPPPPIMSCSRDNSSLMNIKKPLSVKPSNDSWGQTYQIPNKFPPQSPHHQASNGFLPIEQNRKPNSSQRVLMSSGRKFGDENTNTNTSSTTTGGFSFPILNNPNSTPILEDQPRDSLEVFQPPEEETLSQLNPNQMPDCHISFKLRGSPPNSSRPISTIHISTRDDDHDDVASDASSDLFEIESFSTQTTTTAATTTTTLYPTLTAYNHRRDFLDDARRLGGGTGRRMSLDEPMTPSSIAPTECYEPSEASIDWSVTTAEGFDRASITTMSLRAAEINNIHAINMLRRDEAEKSSYGQKRRTSIGNGGGGGGLLSCRSEKAVSVGPQPMRFVGLDSKTNRQCSDDDERHRSRGSGVGLAVSSTLGHVSSRPPIGNQPSLARSHSARLSLTFAA